ncbi:helix-turn-helix domain-containing protein [Streptomyces sp. NPDC056373]|uniref:helix-turn-helix domain-containing protein n=1 Tax=Streptomyces sp. NPDC056373 TaxID=3345798 RepID=UPI0035E01FFF
MATAKPTDPQLAARRASVRHLADEEGMSHRAIARQLGIHHRTVARDLDATAPAATAAPAPQTAPPAPTSGAPRAPFLLHELEPSLIQDLNVLTDHRTGTLYAPIRQYLRAAADARRAAMRAWIERQCATEDAPPRRPDATAPARELRRDHSVT